jgi:hypothetical protein
VPAPDTPLDPVEITTTITAHVSPDAGLATLDAFLAATKESLVIGMYDFTSGRILNGFETDLSGVQTLQMVLDNPAPNPTRDQLDSQTVEQLNSRSDTFASAWMFPFAYHIKVIVRDGDTLWLSSGNLNNSNQPDLSAPPTTEDRDWHVIVQDPGLAKLFTDVLNQDFASAAAQQTAAAPTSEAVTDAHAKLAAEANPPPPARAAANANMVPAKIFPDV